MASLMRDLKLLPFDSSHEEALQVFDLMVQSTRSSIGQAGIRYEWLMAALSATLFFSFDVVASEVFAGASGQAAVATVLGRPTYMCAALPLGIPLLVQLSARCTHPSDVRRIVFVLFLAGGLALWTILWYSVLELALPVAREDVFAFVMLSLVSAACFLLTYVVYRRPPGQQQRRRMETVSETTEELAEALRSYKQQRDAHDVGRRRFEWTSVPMCLLARLTSVPMCLLARLRGDVSTELCETPERRSRMQSRTCQRADHRRHRCAAHEEGCTIADAPTPQFFRDRGVGAPVKCESYGRRWNSLAKGSRTIDGFEHVVR